MTVQNNTAKPTTVDDLLRAKRQSSCAARPSDGFWDTVFAPGLTRRLMAALSRPRHEGRTLTIVGWVTPFVFLGLLATAIGVAWFFSPERAIARWEAGTSSKEYVVDTLSDESHGRSFSVDGTRNNTLKSEQSSEGITAYHFTDGVARDDGF